MNNEIIVIVSVYKLFFLIALKRVSQCKIKFDLLFI